MGDSSYRDLDDAALVASLSENQFALVRARFALSMDRLEDTSSIRVLRKGVARMKTEIRRREVASGLGRDELLRRHQVVPVAGGGAGGAEEASGGFLAGVVDKLGE